MTARRVVVVDGSNLATEGRTTPSLRQLDEAVRAYAQEDPDAEIVVVVDASFEHRIDQSERDQLVEAELHGEVVSPPAGAIGRGDAFVLRIAERTGARVLSNDSFQEFHGEHPWLFDEGRLIGGKPVSGVGWIFTPRIPVRGPKSRQATGKARRAVDALSPPVKAAELAKAAKKMAARKVTVMPDGSAPKVGDVWPPATTGNGAKPKGKPKAQPVEALAGAGEPGGAEPKRSSKKGGAKASVSATGGSGGRKAPAKKAATEKAVAKKATAGTEAATQAAREAATRAAAKAVPAEKKAAKKAPAKKAPAKKAAAKKAATEKAATKKAVAKKAAAKRAPVEEAAVEKAAVEKATVEKATVEKATVEKATVEKAAVEKAAGKKAPAEKAPAKKAPAKKAAVKKAAVAETAAVKTSATKSSGGAQAVAGKAQGAKRAQAASTAPPEGEARGRRPARVARVGEDAVLQQAIDQAMAEVLSPAPVSDGRAAEGRDDKAKGHGGKRRRRRTAEPPPAVNEPLAFINFVASYPLQSELEGEVVSFTSHGAMVDVDLPEGGGTLHCYIPLSAMGDPPPTKARQVLARGERRLFVLVGLDPPRRVAELALPEVAAAAGSAR